MARSVFPVIALFSLVAAVFARQWERIDNSIALAVTAIERLFVDAFPILAPRELADIPVKDDIYARDNRSRAVSFTARRLQRFDQRHATIYGTGGVGLGVALSA